MTRKFGCSTFARSLIFKFENSKIIILKFDVRNFNLHPGQQAWMHPLFHYPSFVRYYLHTAPMITERWRHPGVPIIMRMASRAESPTTRSGVNDGEGVEEEDSRVPQLLGTGLGMACSTSRCRCVYETYSRQASERASRAGQQGKAAWGSQALPISYEALPVPYDYSVKRAIGCALAQLACDSSCVLSRELTVRELRRILVPRSRVAPSQ